MRRRVPRRVAAALVGLAALGLAVLPATPAFAHSYLQSSDPADGSTLTSSPQFMHLRFSESVELAATVLDIVDSAGRHHSPLSLRIARGTVGAAGSTATDTETDVGTEVPSQIVATLPDLAQDTYRVSWRTVSSDDLHATSGVIVFGVGRAIVSSGWHENAPGAAEAALRWLVFLGIAGAVGALLFSRLIRREGGLERHEKRDVAFVAAIRFGAIAALVGLLSDVALLGEQLSASGVPLHRVVTGGYGQRWLLRTGGLVVLLVSLVIAGRARTQTTARRRGTVVAWLGGAVAIVGNATLGHAGASGSLTRVVADAAHMLAVAVWAGTVLVAAFVYLATPHRGVVASALRHFALPATLCVAVMTVTGIYLASDVIGSVDAALVTWYGRAFLLKVALVAVALVFGGINFRRLRRRAPETETGRAGVAVVREAVALALVFAAAAVLLSGQPANEPQLVSVAAAEVVPLLSARVGDLQESMSIRPNVPGNSVVLVQTLDTRRPSPGPVTEVLVTVGPSGSPVAAEAIGGGGWSAPITIAGSDPLDVTVVVKRRAMAASSHTYRWIVKGMPPSNRRVLVSTAPLRMPLQTLAAGITGALLAVAVGGVLGRRRRKTVAKSPQDLPGPTDPGVPADGQVTVG